MTEFPWLKSPAIQQLLHKLVDKLDATEARGNADTLALPLNASNWPDLYRAVFESDKEALWEQILQLHQAGWIQLSPPLAYKNSQGYDAKPKLKVINRDAIRTATGRLERPKTVIERWRIAIDEHLQASEEVKAIAGNYFIDLADHSMVEVVQRLNHLRDLQTETLMLREVSAKLFWGMSKVLDNRAGLVNAILGTDECPFPETPIQLQVYLPLGGFSGVLFIENQVTFERAIRSQNPIFSKLALIFASGFKSSAVRLRSSSSASIYISTLGDCNRTSYEYFESWLFGKNTALGVHFWGDLDWSGMRILKALKETFPTIDAWRLGYEPMLIALESGNGHDPTSAGKVGQLKVDFVGCLYADSRLIPGLQSCDQFIDQELIQI